MLLINNLIEREETLISIKINLKIFNETFSEETTIINNNDLLSKKNKTVQDSPRLQSNTGWAYYWIVTTMVRCNKGR